MKLLFLSPLYLIVPLSMISYLLIQHRMKRKQVSQFVARTNIKLDKSLGFNSTLEGNGLTYRHWFDYLIPVVLAMIVMAAGLHVTFNVQPAMVKDGNSYLLGHYFGSSFVDARACEISIVAITWAFMGSYLFALQYIFRRYVTFDLYPRVYYDVTIRILYAVTIALAIRFVHEDFAASSLAPAIFFVIGSFPDRGFAYLEGKLADLPGWSVNKEMQAKNFPLSMIEGISLLHRPRFKELGIDNVQNLAAADFVELVVRTPFSEEVLINWMFEAKLLVVVGENMPRLKNVGINDVIAFRDAVECDKVGIPGLKTATEISEEFLQIVYARICNDKSISELELIRNIYQEA